MSLYLVDAEDEIARHVEADNVAEALRLWWEQADPYRDVALVTVKRVDDEPVIREQPATQTDHNDEALAV